MMFARCTAAVRPLRYAAQGNSNRRYPWGDYLDTTRFPAIEHPGNGGRNASWSGPAPVDSFAKVGASPFGMVDVIGNVWQWTATEFVDAHTRSVIVRGSSSYVPLTKYAARVIERAPLPR